MKNSIQPRRKMRWHWREKQPVRAGMDILEQSTSCWEF